MKSSRYVCAGVALAASSLLSQADIELRALWALHRWTD
jgi:hypothetical protein